MKYPCPKTGLECETVELCEIRGGCGPLEDVLLKQRDTARARLAEAEELLHEARVELRWRGNTTDISGRIDAFLEAKPHEKAEPVKLVYNRITKKIDKIRGHGLVLESFDPPIWEDYEPEAKP